LLADFLRESLQLGAANRIPLAREIGLVSKYLEIERARFGTRLEIAIDVAPEAAAIEVPPLILQPLVENAVHHGVAHLVEGGEVMVRARQRDGLLELAVENPCDPDRPPSRGAGVGLGNVRSRSDTLFGHRASVDVTAAPNSFRVSIVLPASPAVVG